MRAYINPRKRGRIVARAVPSSLTMHNACVAKAYWHNYWLRRLPYGLVRIYYANK